MNIGERESQDNIKRMGPVINKAYTLGKEKRTDEAFAVLKPYLVDNAVPSYFSQPAGWTIYRYMKAHLSQLLPTETVTLFDYYFQFSPHNPDMMHSCMMILAMGYKKLHPKEFSFINFCKNWGLDNFRDEDYLSTTTTTNDGKPITYQSLVIKVAICLYKELKQNHPQELVTDFMPFFEQVLAKCPDFEFTPLYIANLHAWRGEQDIAARQFKSMLIQNQQWYLWKHLGDLLDDRLKISCYCKALTITNKEDYLGEIHLSLASLLQESFPSQAAYELGVYISTYKAKGWSLKSVAYELENAFRGITPAVDGRSFYEPNSLDAEEYAFSDMPEAEFVYTGERVNSSGKHKACLNNRAKHLYIQTSFIPLLRKATKGEVFLCKYNTKDKRTLLLTIKPTGKKVTIKEGKHDGRQNNDNGQKEIKEIAGKVRIKDGQPFAFVDDFFIPPHLRQSAKLANGQFIKARAAKQQDGRWRIIRVISKD